MDVGNPTAVFEDAFLSEVYGCRIWVNRTPGNELPFVLPQTMGVAPHRQNGQATPHQ